MDFIRKRRRAFHRKRKVKLGSSLSHGGALERSHNMVVGQVFRKTIGDIGKKKAEDVFDRIAKKIKLPEY